MKRWILCGVLFGAVSPAMAGPPSAACAAKRADIEAQLSAATARGHKREMAGLQTALRANKANCTDKSLARARDNDIQQAQKKVAERERDLADARRKGDVRKIADREAKLEDARRELSRAGAPLAR